MIDINCDVGEGLHNEPLIMPYITSCNIACGGHAGDHASMRNVINIAREHHVKIGAHPSYPDRENFGRTSMDISAHKLSDAILTQIQSLEKIANDLDVDIHHIKPHGALYNDLAKDHTLTDIFLTAIAPYKRPYKLYAPYGSVISDQAIKRGYDVVFEAFADRNYTDDLSLVSRSKAEALITDPEQIITHVMEIQNNQHVKTISGKRIPIKASTFCVHSDTHNAVNIVKQLYQKFQ